MPSAGSPYDVSPLRYRLKKVARRAAVGVGRILPYGLARRPQGIRVLTYHRFGVAPLDPCCLDPAEFEAQLDWLGRRARVLTPQQFGRIMSRGDPTPAGAVLLTIDDGHGSVAQHALAALARRGMKAVLFVCPALVGTTGFMDWQELAAANADGHVVAPHGHSHRSLGRMPIDEATREIDTAHAALRRLGAATPFFSFPFGTRADWSPPLLAALQSRGYRYCFSARHGSCLPGTQAAPLPRIKIEGGGEMDLFAHIVGGCLDHWRVVDDTLFRLQQRGRM